MDPENEGEEVTLPRKLNSDEKRQHKIKKFKENKELEMKIKAYQGYAAKFVIYLSF